jgi:tRNA (adenine57-N1/adenine58-N1)-methyltransferase catalytic subunit
LSSITPKKKFGNTGHRKGEEVENVYQTIYGAFKVKDLIGLKFGSKVVLSKGYCYALYPTPELWTKAQCHKTFFVRNLRIFVISWGVCPWQAFPV